MGTANTTLGDLHRATPWVWVYCERCQHHGPLACAVAVIRWGPDMSSDKLRQSARCTRCGNKGATIQHPGWGGNDIGFLPFPTEQTEDCGEPPTYPRPDELHSVANEKSVKCTVQLKLWKGLLGNTSA
jgi:hypothetical protein